MAFYPPELTSPPLPLVAVLSTTSLPEGIDRWLASHLSASSRPPMVAVAASAVENEPLAEALARLFGPAKQQHQGTLAVAAATSSPPPVPSARGGGVLKAEWLASQRQRRAAAAVVLLKRQESDPDSGAAWLRTRALLAAVRQAATPRSSAVVAVVLSDSPGGGPAPPLPPSWERAVREELGGREGGGCGDDADEGGLEGGQEVHVYCVSGPDAFPELYSGAGGGGRGPGGSAAAGARASEDANAAAANAAADDDDPLAAPARRAAVEDALGPLVELVRLCARRYYARRAAKVSAKLAALSAAMGGGGNAAAALSPLSLLPPARVGEALIKLGTFAEMQGDWPSAAEHYQAAHRALAGAGRAIVAPSTTAEAAASAAASAGCPSPSGPHAHAQVARAAEVAHYKALTLLMHQGGRQKEAREQARLHLAAFCRAPPPRAWPAGARAAHRAWCVRQFDVALGMLFSSAGSAAQAGPLEDDAEPDAAAAAADDARELSPRYLALAAAECALARQELALSLSPEERRMFPGGGGASVRRGPFLGQLLLRQPLAAAAAAAGASALAPPLASAAAPSPAVCGSPLAVGLMERLPQPRLSGGAAATLPPLHQQQQQQGRLYVERPLTEDEYAAWAAAEETRAVAAAAVAGGVASSILPSQQQAMDAVAAAASSLQQQLPVAAGPGPSSSAPCASPRLVARLAAAAAAGSGGGGATARRAPSVAAAYWARSEGWDAELLAALAALAAASPEQGPEAALCALEAAAISSSTGAAEEESARRALAAIGAAKADYCVQHLDARAAQVALMAAEMAALAHAGWLRVLSLSAGFAAAATAPPTQQQQQQQPRAFFAALLNHAPVGLALESVEVALSDALGSWTAKLAPVDEAENDGGALLLAAATKTSRWRRFASPLRWRCPGPLRADKLVLRLVGGATVSFLLPSFPPPSAAAAVPLLLGGNAPAVVASAASALGPGPLAALVLRQEGDAGATTTNAYSPQPGCFVVAAPLTAGGEAAAGAGAAAALLPPRISLEGGRDRALLGELVPIVVRIVAPSSLPEGAFVELTAAHAPVPPLRGGVGAAAPLSSLELLTLEAAPEEGGEPSARRRLRALATSPEGGGGTTARLPLSPGAQERALLRVWLRCPAPSLYFASSCASSPHAAAASVRVSAVLRAPPPPATAAATAAAPVVSAAPPLSVLFAPPFQHDAELRAEPGVHVLVGVPSDDDDDDGSGGPLLAVGQTFFATVRVRLGPGLQEDDDELELLDARYQAAGSMALLLPPSSSSSLLLPSAAPMAFGPRKGAQALSLILPLRATAPSEGPVSLGSVVLRWRRRKGQQQPVDEADANVAVLALPVAAAVRASPLATARVVVPSHPVAPGLPGWPLEVQVFNQQQPPVVPVAVVPVAAVAGAAQGAEEEQEGEAPAAPPPPPSSSSSLSLLLELQPEVGLQPLGEHLAYTMDVPPGEGRAARWQMRAVASGGTGGVRVRNVPAVRVSTIGGGAVVATQRLGLRVGELGAAAP